MEERGLRRPLARAQERKFLLTIKKVSLYLLILTSYCCYFYQGLAAILVLLWRDFTAVSHVTLTCYDGSVEAHKFLSWPLSQHCM